MCHSQQLYLAKQVPDAIQEWKKRQVLALKSVKQEEVFVVSEHKAHRLAEMSLKVSQSSLKFLVHLDLLKVKDAKELGETRVNLNGVISH